MNSLSMKQINLTNKEKQGRIQINVSKSFIKIWELIPENIKSSESVDIFKKWVLVGWLSVRLVL